MWAAVVQNVLPTWCWRNLLTSQSLPHTRAAKNTAGVTLWRTMGVGLPLASFKKKTKLGCGLRETLGTWTGMES